MNTGRTTALKRFARLETTGLWRPAADAQRREVVVSFGEATVMIADGAGRPLTHWSLPAVERLNPGAMPALYAPDSDASETLELDDMLMIEALEQVRGAVAAAQPHPGFLRRGGIWAVLGALALAALFWAPGALKRQTLLLVPEATRQEIGATLLGLIQRETGPACREPMGLAALDRLMARLYGEGSGLAAVVLPGAMPAPVRLPGGLVAVPRSAVAATDDPYVLAGAVVAAMAATGDGDPLQPVLDAAGLRATLTLLATGTLPAAPLEPLAHRLIAGTPPPGDPAALAAAFDAARLPIGPWAQAQGLADPGGAAAGDAPPVMSDSDWVALQNICTE